MPKPFKTVLMFHFNPRSREGSDCRSLFRFSRSCDFNPRSREGSDPNGYFLLNSGVLFQSTLPRGERHCWCPLYLLSNVYFNPRSREGSDNLLLPVLLISKHFNPRSREGSDEKSESHLYRRHAISIHAPARGATT